MARQTLKKHLTDDKKFSRMESWLMQEGYSKDNAKTLTEKYGMYAYDLIKKAMMSPYTLKLKDGEAIGKTSDTIKYLLDNELSAEIIAPNVGASAEKVAADIAEFRRANDIPTKLPVPEVAIQAVEVKKQKIEEKITPPSPPQVDLRSSKEETIAPSSPLQQPPVHASKTVRSIRLGNMPEIRFTENTAPVPVAEKTAAPTEKAVSPENTSSPAAELSPAENTSAPVIDPEQQWIEQELAKMKGSTGGEISFERLSKSGLTKEDMQNALTEEDVKNVHAGPISQRLARCTKKYERCMTGSGNCLSAFQRAAADTVKLRYSQYPVEKLPGRKGNSACFCHQVLEQCGEFAVFRFKNDCKNGNACLNPPPCAGAIVNFDRGKTMHGHVTVSDGTNGYDCDLHQSADRIASGIRADGKPYGENFYISFTKDCTVTDELARKMLHERYIREHPNTNEQTKEQTQTPSREVPQNVSDSIQNINREKILNQRFER